ncbi:MAG: hypothetical protein L0G23_01185 [Ruaniaceae bacterium]|nr:hypothetical protein [Ruaniaceae bacterium]
MTSAHAVVPPVTAPAQPRFRSDGAADRFMRRLLGITATDRRSTEQAHRAFRVSVVISGVRCLITYLLVPVLVPILSLAGWVAAPIGLALCAVAAVSGIVSVRRFWLSDHRYRWMYTAFIGVVFVVLALALISDLNRLGVIA